MKRIHTAIFTILLILGIMFMPTISVPAPFSNQDEGCEDCHSEFNAFTLTVDAPSEVPEDYEFEFKVIVRNHGEHEVQGLQALLSLSEASTLEPLREGGEPFHDEISGSVNVGGTQTYSFPVVEGASEAIISLDGDEGFLGRNDIDLTVTGPSGEVWQSADPGADEALNLDFRDLERGGYGDYNVIVEYFIGGPSISYSLTIDVEYSASLQILQGPDLAPGEEHIFVWPLKSLSKGENTVNVAVSGTAYYEHSENDDSVTTDSKEYTFDESSSLKVGDKLVYQSPNEDFQGSMDILFLERITGLLSGVFLILSIAFCGYFKPLCSTIEKITEGRANRCKWHCRVSLVLLFIALFHGLLLPFSPYARTLTGLALGTPAFLILGALGYIGWQQKILMKQWGMEKWRKLHLVLTIAVVIIVIIHAVLDGSDFAWLR